MGKGKVCEICDDFIALGEGDFLCSKNNVLVVTDYTPTDSYAMCRERGNKNESSKQVKQKKG